MAYITRSEYAWPWAPGLAGTAARDDPQSPIYGMPILDVDKAKAVLFVKALD